MVRGVQAFNPDGEFVVRRFMTTDRDYAAGDDFNKESVTPRRLRHLFDTRKIVPSDMLAHERRNLITTGPLTTNKAGNRLPYAERRKQRAAAAREATDADAPPQEPSEEIERINAVIAEANSVPFPTFKHDVTEILGTGNVPSKKVDMIAALEAKRDALAAQ